MFKKIADALKVKEIRKRLLFVLFALVVIRVGSQIPVPGADRSYLQKLFEEQSSSAFNFFDAFTGGSFSNFSILALSITPYITSSIIIQLMTIAIPALEEMSRDGDDGRKKLTRITRFLTVALAIFESSMMAWGFGNQGLIPNNNLYKGFIVVCALTAGSAFLMWIGEQITEHGVGNGISIVLLINIVSRIPNDLVSLYKQFIEGKKISYMLLSAAIIIAIILFVIVLVIILDGAKRQIPVQYSKKMAGRKLVGGQSSNIPLKVNTAGVIPVIFASSIMSFPGIIASFMGRSESTGIVGTILGILTDNNWFKTSKPIYNIGILIYILLVVFFAYFYTSITFNPLEIADNMKKQGGFIPGIRPGKPTSDYLSKVLHYIIFIGAVGLIIVALLPLFFNGVFNASVSFGGTSLIIIVGVVLETIKQIESMMVVRNYKGFLND